MTIFKVETGFGYFLDPDGHVYCKANLPPGDHNLKDGFSYVEVATQEALDMVEVYVAPKSQDELDEEKITKKVVEITRFQAIQSLKDAGELPANYRDKKIKAQEAL